MGAIGCSSQVLKSLLQQKYLVSRQTDSLGQLGLSAWIKDGGFERHLRRMRRIYEKRYFHMLNELEKTKAHSNISWSDPNGGMSIWVNFQCDSQKLAELAKKRGIFFQTENTMDYSGSPGTHLRIGFAGVSEKEITEGFDVLRSLL